VPKRNLGKAGEELAANYLAANGYSIVTRNFHTRYGELDLVCKKNGMLVFVEVKTRTKTAFGYPAEAVTRQKRERIKKAALLFIDAHPQSFCGLRFDVIAILITPSDIKIDHIQEAF
jgi:putative endonuclease